MQEGVRVSYMVKVNILAGFDYCSDLLSQPEIVTHIILHLLKYL